MSERPYTTLFLLQSVDGKISTGDTDTRDFDADLPLVPGVKEGLHQYYEIEQQTDPFSLITGRVMAKIGVNIEPFKDVKQIPVSFVVVDNKPHLTTHGAEHLSRKFSKLFIVTTDKNHPAHEVQKKYANVTVLDYRDAIDFPDMFAQLKSKYGAKRLTIQSGGELNAVLLRAGLIDAVLLVIAPCLIGGRDTSTLIDGKSLRTAEDLAKIRPLRLKSCTPLANSYLKLEYEVANQ